MQVYGRKKNIVHRFIKSREFSKEYKIGDKIDLPFFSAKIQPHNYLKAREGDVYYFKFNHFDRAVQPYININVQPESQGSSVLRMRLNGTNKSKLVDYLNTSIQVLDSNMLKRKNLYATKTIEFIDNTLKDRASELAAVEDELNKFKNENEIFDLATEGRDINVKLNALDVYEVISILHGSHGSPSCLLFLSFIALYWKVHHGFEEIS